MPIFIACTLTPTLVFALPMPIFLNLLKANNLFCYFFMTFFAEELRRSERMRKNQLNMTVIQWGSSGCANELGKL